MAQMNDVHMPAIDLNLLVALDALLRERNVTRAAARVGLSQSAMSHALRRLRTLVDDELLVRTPRGMVPTARAEALGPPIQRALEEVRRALAPARFDPATARGRVLLATSDYIELVLLPPLVDRLAREAPGIDLRALPLGDDIALPFAAGAVDIVVTPPDTYPASAGVFIRRLFDDGFVCVVRRGHPLAKQRLTTKRFLEARHCLISPRGQEGGLVDALLARRGLSRRVAVAVPHFLIAPHLVAASDLVLTLAERIAELLAPALGLTVLELPTALRPERFELAMFWHERTHGDPMLQWVREQIVSVARAL